MINDKGSETELVLMAGGEEISIGLINARSKTRWLEMLGPRTNSGLVLEKNSARKAPVLMLDGADEDGDAGRSRVESVSTTI